MTYQRIKNFPENAAAYGSAELKALAKVWLERRETLHQTGVFQEFLKKLQREWAVETGIIERLYTWDRGVTEVLIEQGIDASLIAHKAGIQRNEAEQITSIIADQLAIAEGLFSFVKGEQPLTEHYVRSLQAEFTAHQDHINAITPDGQPMTISIERGKYKTLPNNPKRPDGEMHEYCPPELVPDEMQQLIAWYREHEEHMPTEVKAAWLHHRFTQIHPFQDGNGRVARALASLVFLKERCFPLVIRDADRQEYIGALEVADSGDLKPLTAMFARRQKEAILRALGLEQQVRQSSYAEQIISSALQLLKDRHAATKQHVGRVYEYADELTRLAESRMEEIAKLLNEQLGGLTLPQQDRYEAYCTSAQHDSQHDHYFHNQIVSIANQFDYFANLDRHRSWVRITIKTVERFELVVSIHGYGYGDSGIMAATAFMYRRVAKEEGGTEPVNVQAASVDLFQFNYAESLNSTKERFHDWLESALAIGLGEWKRLVAA